MIDGNALTRDNPILVKFRAALNEMYGERIERALLYGSRARGDASADSDYDVAGFLKDLSDRWAEADKIERPPLQIFSGKPGRLITPCRTRTAHIGTARH